MRRLTRRQFVLGAATAGAALAAAGVGTRSEADEGEETEEHESTRLRRWAMVIDLRQCDGCVDQGVPPQCTQYCIWGHSVPEDQQWVEVFAFEELKDVPTSELHFMPILCQQCQNPPCTNVCPVGATFSTPEGVVLIDQERCIGCRMCMAACPYDRRFFNWKEPAQLPEIKDSPYNIFHQTPAIKGTVMKCNWCPERTMAGGLPFCVEGCPHGAMYFGDLEEDIATNGQEIVVPSRFLSENQAYHLREDLGTKPRVYYIAGHGEAAGRDAFSKGRLPTVWPWMERVKGAKTWKR